VKTNGTRCSPAFKFQVVLEALKPEGKGSGGEAGPSGQAEAPAVLYTDFTEIRCAEGAKKAHLMAMVDPGSAWVGSWKRGPTKS